ncbi:MAG: heme exporter protein CcmD [Achromobacter sp.]|jgi:heme exporter protein CcmD|uniref:heme exporter protein CcmD n=1 Tax=unclassified Achromobacter TaxID=2626865 RepID=UPI000E75B301|nr:MULTISPECIES: heme exporter protein CcmD [unclassified Achromobacter]AYD64150.1 heme exporter protein CcmD [Achromobacter sp. B7]MDX3985777.1 heme exporter protein CcmD [Achromobacter sp.]HCQ48572.1 heme exporter protein CcmD [Achromobacter sp.]
MSWDALFSLQGHGPYLLGAYGVTAALMALEVFSLWRRARKRSGMRTPRQQFSPPPSRGLSDPPASSGRP